MKTLERRAMKIIPILIFSVLVMVGSAKTHETGDGHHEDLKWWGFSSPGCFDIETNKPGLCSEPEKEKPCWWEYKSTPILLEIPNPTSESGE